jgi:hypothetical protein
MAKIQKETEIIKRIFPILTFSIYLIQKME